MFDTVTDRSVPPGVQLAAEADADGLGMAPDPTVNSAGALFPGPANAYFPSVRFTVATAASSPGGTAEIPPRNDTGGAPAYSELNHPLTSWRIWSIGASSNSWISETCAGLVPRFAKPIVCVPA